MSRKNQAPIRKVLPDPVFNSKIITKLINGLMLEGKKQKAQSIVYKSFEIIKENTGQDPVEVFEKALANIEPQLEVKTKRIGGSNYQIPVQVTERRKNMLTSRWLVRYARLRNEKTMEVRLANEIIDASKGLGASVKKREDTHKMAESNRAFAHYNF